MVCVFFYVKHETKWHRLQEKCSEQYSQRTIFDAIQVRCKKRMTTHHLFFSFSLKALKYICTSKRNGPSNPLVATLAESLTATKGSKDRHQIQYGSYRSTSIGTWSFTTVIRSHRTPKNKNWSRNGHQPACAYASIVIRRTLCEQCRGGFAGWGWTVQKHSANVFLICFLNFMFGRTERTPGNNKNSTKNLVRQYLQQNKEGCYPIASKATPKTQLYNQFKFI